MGQPLIKIGSGTDNGYGFVYDNSRNLHPQLDGFTIYYDQNSPPAGFEDKFYVHHCDFDTEGEGTYVGSVTTVTDHFTISGLQSGLQYAVRIFRYVNGVYDSASWPPYGAHGKTLEIDYPLGKSETISLAEPWSKKLNDIAFDPSGTMYRAVPKRVAMNDADMGNFLRISDPDNLSHITFYDEFGDPTGTQWIPWNPVLKAVYPPDKMLTFEWKARWNDACIGAGFDFGITLYNEEFEYIGLYTQYSAPSSLHTIVQNSNYGAAGAGPTFTAPNVVHAFKVVWNPSTKQTLFYMDNVLHATCGQVSTQPWRAPIALWLFWFPAGATTRVLDFGEITVTVGGASDQYAGMSGWMPAANWADDIITKVTPICSQEEYFQMGGITGAHNIGAGELPFGYQWGPGGMNDWPPYTQWVTGITTVNTPIISLPTADHRFFSLDLRGRQNNGYLKVQVVDINGNLLSDAQVPGNSTGFMPDNPIYDNVDFPKLSVVLSGITITAIRLKITSYYDGTTILSTPYNNYYTPSILNSFMVTIVPPGVVYDTGGVKVPIVDKDSQQVTLYDKDGNPL